MYGIDQSEPMTLRMKDLQPRVPSWARAEQLEITVSQAELWKYADDLKARIGIHITETLACFKSRRL